MAHAPTRARWLAAGLFLVTLATLMLEVIDTRLLSVLTWYHLSFLAVSVAMLGMAGGAVIVFSGGEMFAPSRAARILPGATIAFALVLALSHVANLTIPISTLNSASAANIAPLAISTLVLTLPFIASGIVVTLALTRTGGAIGFLYGADLLGAACGCLLIVWVLERTDITSSALVSAAVAALGAVCFARYAGTRVIGAIVATALLIAAAAGNAATGTLGIIYPKDQRLWFRKDIVQYSKWNAHSNVTVNRPAPTQVFYWGPAANAPATSATLAYAAVDGFAGTAITQWNGDPSALSWTRYDVTSVPYHLRSGRAAIIGVGGGRDILTAIGGGSTPITGIEINGAFVSLLTDRYRDFAKIATHPGVTLVHDEARSSLTRTTDRFDVLQMSLIDTWAATGAGAFTLTENGLYTREGWRVFLRTLTPTGVFSVSRWFDPANVTETTRLVALGTAALMDFGVTAPRRHLMLITRGSVATMMVSPSPFSDADRARVEQLRGEYGYEPAVTPWRSAGGQLERILAATSIDELHGATRDPFYDYTPPSDSRPFFFNMLKPRAALQLKTAGEESPGVFAGNLVATRTLLALAAIAAVLVAGIIAWPLLRGGRADLPTGVFGTSLVYFGAIGFGFMFVQIPLLQRFSVYLGHPTYTFSIVLFLMILAAGVGSFASDRLSLAGTRAISIIPLATAALALGEAFAMQPLLDATVAWQLPGRTFVVAILIAPLAFLMGHCFPIGVRLLGEHSDRAAAWMWGVNGACGVMASIFAVMLSMWVSIDAGLMLAAALYALLVWPAKRLSGPARTARAPLVATR